jgi:Uma2 family endonuclease
MGFEATIHVSPRRIDLNVDDWRILERSGSLQGWRRVELIDGRAVRYGKRHKLSVRDYEALQAEGRFDDWTKVELIDGELFGMNAQYRKHALVKTRLCERINQALRAGAFNFEAVSEAAVEVMDVSLPEPDIVVTSEPDGDRFVPLWSVKLVVEVSDTTLARDLKRKLRLYGKAEIPEYWVVDIPGRQVRQFWAPFATGYACDKIVRFGDALNSMAIPRLEVETEGLL